MKTNKLFKGLAALALCSSVMVGCSNEPTGMKKVAIVQLGEHTSLNTIKEAFDTQMEALGYIEGENVEYVFKNAQFDTTIAASIAQDFKEENADVIMAIATTVAMAVAPLSTTTPIVFSAVSDPVGAGLTGNLDNPDLNMTGTSDEIQVELILDKALEVNPDLKKLGVIYNKGEANSITNIAKAQAYADSKGIEIIEATITNINEVQSAINVLTSKCDAIFAPNDNTVANAMSLVSQACATAKVPLYVGADSMVADGGFLSVGINYEDLGKETANMVHAILTGTAAADLPVKVFKEDLKIYVNEAILNQIGVTLPESISNDPSFELVK